MIKRKTILNYLCMHNYASENKNLLLVSVIKIRNNYKIIFVRNFNLKLDKRAIRI